MRRCRIVCASFTLAAAVGLVSVASTGDTTVSLDYSDTRAVKILEELGRKSGFDLLFDEKFDDDKRISITVSDVSAMTALGYVARLSRNFVVTKSPGVLLVAPDTRQKRQQYENRERREFELQHTAPRNVITVLRAILQVRELVHNERLNSVVMTDTEHQLDLAEELIRRIDRETAPAAGHAARDPLWIGDARGHDLGDLGDPLPTLQVDTTKTVSLETGVTTAGELYRRLGEVAGIQFVFADEIDLGQKAGASFSKATLADTLDALNDSLGHFSVVWGPDLVFIAPDDRIHRYADEQQLVQIFYLEHAETREFVTLLRSQLQMRQIAEVPGLQAVVVRGEVARVEDAQRLRQETDRPAAH